MAVRLSEKRRKIPGAGNGERTGRPRAEIGRGLAIDAALALRRMIEGEAVRVRQDIEDFRWHAEILQHIYEIDDARLAALADDNHLLRIDQRFEIIEKGRKREEIPPKLRRKTAHERERRLEGLPRAGQQMQFRENLEHDAVSGRHGIVHRVLGADNQRLGIIGGVKEAARRILKMRAEYLYPFLRPGEVEAFSRHLKKDERGPRHVGVIIEKAGVHGPADAVAVIEPAIWFHGMRCNGDKGALRRIDPVRLVEIMSGT